MKPKPFDLVLAINLTICPASAEVHEHTAIKNGVKENNRWPIFDQDKDGWDDLWPALFPRIDTTRPGLDEDNDGHSNYEEMLDFKDPYFPKKPFS